MPKHKTTMARVKQTMEFKPPTLHRKVAKKNSLGLSDSRDVKSLERKRSGLSGAPKVPNLLTRKKNTAPQQKGKGFSFTSLSSEDRSREHVGQLVMPSGHSRAQSGNVHPQVAQHLNKNYFLNSKQLLKLLSPPRDAAMFGNLTTVLNQTQQAGIAAQQGDTDPGSDKLDDLRQYQSGLTTHTGRSGTVQGQTKSHGVKKRNRSSIGINVLSGESIEKARSSSHSGRYQTRNKPQVRKSIDQQNVQKQVKMDKLIKTNLKKQRAKTENELAIKELIEMQQSQRRTQLDRLNAKVRNDNRSKLGGNVEKVRSLSGQRRTSMSDEQTLAAQTAKVVIPFSATHGRQKGFKFGQQQQKSSNSQSSGRPKIFDEIKALTKEIQNELGERNMTVNTTKGEQAQHKSARNSDLNLYSGFKRVSKKNTSTMNGNRTMLEPRTTTSAAAGNSKLLPEQKKRASFDVQKFMEKKQKKAKQQKKASINSEAEKKMKIQNNLMKLNRQYEQAKRNSQYEKSRSTMGLMGTHSRQKSIPLTTKNEKTRSKSRKKHKTLSNVNQIFQQKSAGPTDQDYNRYLANYEDSAQMNRSQQRRIKYQKARKVLNASGTDAAPHASSGFGVKPDSGRGLQNYHSYNPPVPSRPMKYPSVSQATDEGKQKLVQTKSPPEQRNLSTIEQATRPPFDRSISANDVSDDEPGVLKFRNMKNGKKGKKVKAAHQITRIHELVALYRCKFKQGASDASIMGTLHLAASIIQIHFRYQKQLKEAQRLKLEYKKKKMAEKKETTGRSAAYINTNSQESLPKPSARPSEVVSGVISTENSRRSGPKAPVIPELNFSALFRDPRQKPQAREVANTSQANRPQSAGAEHLAAPPEQEAKTVSSYSGIFHRVGLPLPRSARVKVEYGQIERDPALIEQIRTVVQLKEQKGAAVLRESRKLELISERTYNAHATRLEKWVSVKNDYLQDQMSRSRQRPRQLTSDDLLEEAEIARERFSKITAPELDRASLASQSKHNGLRSARSLRSQSLHAINGRSERGGDTLRRRVELGPYGQPLTPKDTGSQAISGVRHDPNTQQMSKQTSDRNLFGEAKQVVHSPSQDQPEPVKPFQKKVGELVLNSKSSRTSNAGAPNCSSESSKPEGAVVINSDTVDQLIKIHETRDSKSNEDRKSLTKSLLSQLEHADEFLPPGQPSLAHSAEKMPDGVNTQQISSNRLIEHAGQLEAALEEQNKATDPSPPEAQQPSMPAPVATEEVNVARDKLPPDLLNALRETETTGPGAKSPVGNAIHFVDHEMQGQQSDAADSPPAEMKNEGLDGFNALRAPALEIEIASSTGFKPRDSDVTAGSQPNLESSDPTFSSHPGGSSNVLPHATTSPVSDTAAHEIRIQTGAHSLSSTNSDMTRVMAQNHEQFDSPPNVLSPQNGIGFGMGSQRPALVVNDEQQQPDQPAQQEQPMSQQEKFADELSTILLHRLLGDVLAENQVVLPRAQLRPQNIIRYYDPRRGIETDLSAIERYVDELLQHTNGNPQVKESFQADIKRNEFTSQAEQLSEMQNSDIGTFAHFYRKPPGVLGVDTFLALEHIRKERIEEQEKLRAKEEKKKKNSKQERSNHLQEFGNVTDQELAEEQDEFDRRYLVDCQHIHNKVLFDCMNDSLNQFRPFGKDGPPAPWSRLDRKIRPGEGFAINEMFEVAKHDLFRMAIMQAGTLPRRDFEFGGQFDEELFTELREKKLATLLCREIVASEPQWLKWDFEEAQTKIDISDMVLEHLVAETIGVLNDVQGIKPDKAEPQEEAVKKALDLMEGEARYGAPTSKSQNSAKKDRSRFSSYQDRQSAEEQALQSVIDEYWDIYDLEKTGALGKDATAKFVVDTLGHFRTAVQFSQRAFDEVFAAFDTDKSGTIGRGEMAAFIQHLLRT